MNRLRNSIRKYLPRRRRRFWRYVSGRRRHLGLVLFSLLILGMYGWWSFTNDRRMVGMAEAYLRKLTGAQVHIQNAHFNLFDGIKLSGVRVYNQRGDSTEEIFRAKELWLRARPLSMLSGDAPRVDEIICVDPVVTLSRDTQGGQWNFRSVLPLEGEDTASRIPVVGQLPTVRLRNARVCRTTSAGQVKETDALPAVNVLLDPDPDGPVYNITVELANPQAEDAPPGGAIACQGTWNRQTGEYNIRGWLTVDILQEALSGQYKAWCDRYQLRGGKLGVQAEGDGGPMSQRVIVELEGATLTLPPNEGGLTVTDLTGTMVFTPRSVTIEMLTGRVGRLGNAHITLGGAIDGYRPDSPFDITVSSDDLTFPFIPDGTSEVAGILADAQKLLSLTGMPKVSVRVSRDRDGAYRLAGEASPRGMSVTLEQLPYTLDDLRGTVELSNAGLTIRELTGRHGEATVVVTGVLRDPLGQLDCEIHVAGTRLSLDGDLREALPRTYQRVFDRFSPRGRCDVAARISKTAGDDDWATDLTIGFDGRASMEYREFPYRLNELRGQISVRGRDVRIGSPDQPISGVRNGVTVSLSGSVVHAGSADQEVRVEFSARNLLLADDLATALPAAARRTFDSFHPSGRADVVGFVGRIAGEPIDYDFTVAMNGVKLKYDGFPYAMERATGKIAFTPVRVTVDDVTGWHGPTKIVVSGTVNTDRAPAGIDLGFAASNLAFDAPLRKALPDNVAEIWDRVSPGGVADVDFALFTDGGPGDKPADYDLLIWAKGVSATYKGFAYPVSGISGTAHATPGRVELDLTGGDETPLKLVGSIIAEGATGSADLTLAIDKLPVDKQFIAALPTELESIRDMVSPGGTLKLDLSELVYSWRPAGRPAVVIIVPGAGPGDPTDLASLGGRPTTRPQSPDAWRLAGRIDLNKVNVRMASSVAEVTGFVEGGAESGGREGDLVAAADMSLDSVILGKHRLEKVSATATKRADQDSLLIDDLRGRFYGGRVGGLVRIQFGQTPKYGLKLDFEGIRLDDMLNEGKTDPKKLVKGSGILQEGTLRLTGTLGGTEGREGSGVLKISEAKLGRLPVLVSLAQVSMLKLPGDTLFDKATVEYALSGEDLTLNSIYLGSATVSMLGSGTLKNNDLDLLFLSGPSRSIPPGFRELGEWISITARELSKVTVTGPPDDPTVIYGPVVDIDQLRKQLVGLE